MSTKVHVTGTRLKLILKVLTELCDEFNLSFKFNLAFFKGTLESKSVDAFHLYYDDIKLATYEVAIDYHLLPIFKKDVITNLQEHGIIKIKCEITNDPERTGNIQP